MKYPIIINDEDEGLTFILPDPKSGQRAIIKAIPDNPWGYMATNIHRAEFGKKCWKKVEAIYEEERKAEEARLKAIKHKPIETWTASDARNLLNPNAKSSALLSVALAPTEE